MVYQVSLTDEDGKKIRVYESVTRRDAQEQFLQIARFAREDGRRVRVESANRFYIGKLRYDIEELP